MARYQPTAVVSSKNISSKHISSKNISSKNISSKNISSKNIFENLFQSYSITISLLK
ncbi:hypothetical protein [Methanosarcina sp.]|uniref:hypothetical protein n=1 Tax=Methanosarcina sp. TaxID=2213 RepID=UPI003C71A243